MPTRNRRQKYEHDLQREILDAAREIFLRDGYEGFTMRKVATEINYSVASIYRHFRGKDELFQSLVKESFEMLTGRQADPALDKEVDHVEALKLSMWNYVQFGLDHPGHYRFAFLMQPNAARSDSSNAAFDSLRQRVARVVDAGLLKTDDVEITAQAVWAAVHGVTSLLISDPCFPWVERKQLIVRVIDSAVDSLTER